MAQNPDSAEVNKLKLVPSDRLEKWRHFGYRLMLLGMSPQGFMDKLSVRQVLVYVLLFLTLCFYSLHEIIVAAFFSRSLLEQVTHFYIMTYIFAFFLQWYYMLWHIRTFHENEVYLEHFESTKAHFQFAERKLDENIDIFLKYFAISTAWWSTNIVTHVFGPIIESVITFIREGAFKKVVLLPQAFALPWWAHITMYLHNSITTTLLLVYCMASFIILGSRVLKVKTQCDIINEALRNDTKDESNIRAYIKDHVIIIKTAKVLNGQMATLNGIIFTACYLEFATQMFALTLFEQNGAYYFALAFDLLSIMLILTIQCWLASIVTLALESVADAIYETSWYKRDKNNSLNVLMMLQMAQREYSQTIWFKSFKVERAAILSINFSYHFPIILFKLSSIEEYRQTRCKIGSLMSEKRSR